MGAISNEFISKMMGVVRIFWKKGKEKEDRALL